MPTILSILITYLAIRLCFRNDLHGRIEEQVKAEPLSANGKLVLVGLGCVIAVLLTASALDKDLGLPTCAAALTVTAVISIKAEVLK